MYKQELFLCRNPNEIGDFFIFPLTLTRFTRQTLNLLFKHIPFRYASFLVACFISISVAASAQTTADTTHAPTPAPDSAQHITQTFAEPAPGTQKDEAAAEIKKGPFQPNPKKSGLYSAIIPGLGQLYNRQYWKVPVIYVGIGVAAYFFETNLTSYRDYRSAYIGRVNNPYPTDKYVNLYTEDQLKQLQTDYEQYLDLTALFAGIGYILQVMDAIVFAHLKNFDVSKDLSFRMSPVVYPNGGAGFGLVMNIKNRSVLNSR
jgi:hypothetical protein